MRQKWTASSDAQLYKQLKELSALTRIPAARLLDEAIEDLLEKHDFESLKLAHKEKENKKK